MLTVPVCSDFVQTGQFPFLLPFPMTVDPYGRTLGEQIKVLRWQKPSHIEVWGSFGVLIANISTRTQSFADRILGPRLLFVAHLCHLIVKNS